MDKWLPWIMGLSSFINSLSENGSFDFLQNKIKSGIKTKGNLTDRGFPSSRSK